MVTFRIRECTRDIKGSPGHADYKGYWVYASNDEFEDYYTALEYAIDIEKSGGYKNWVECTSCDEMLMLHDPTYKW